jgi:HipA-like kinase
LRAVPHLVAATYHRKMSSGRTKPMLFSCEDQKGNPAGEFVVKLKGGVNNGVTGLTSELLSSLLAEFLGIAAPEPALIDLDSSLAEVLPERDAEEAEIIRKSAGVNFWTRLRTGGYRIWPVDMAIPIGLRQEAVDIFAFDALIQNPDRRYDNPNILWRDEEMFVIDHESAFSFI